MKYTVHVYAVVRVPVEVEASSQIEAIETVEKDFTLNDGDAHLGTYRGSQIFNAEEITSFGVDEGDDKDFRDSRHYKYDPHSGELVEA